MLLVGHIDESFDEQAFTLACVISEGLEWLSLEQAWMEILNKKNESLRRQKRKTLSRYHATDCNGRRKEFKRWNPIEQIEFVKQLLAVVNKHNLKLIAYSVDLRQLAQEIPITKIDPRGFSYVVLLRLIMAEIGDTILNRNHVISLIHERCNYDTALLEAFNQTILDPTFRYPGKFVNITPMAPIQCIPLQAADFFAFETLKEFERQSGIVKRNTRRKSLEVVVNEGQLGGNARAFNKASLEILKQLIDEMDERTREMLLLNARLKKRTQKAG